MLSNYPSLKQHRSLPDYPLSEIISCRIMSTSRSNKTAKKFKVQSSKNKRKKCFPNNSRYGKTDRLIISTHASTSVVLVSNQIAAKCGLAPRRKRIRFMAGTIHGNNVNTGIRLLDCIVNVRNTWKKKEKKKKRFLHSVRRSVVNHLTYWIIGL
jgi:hypothetical protein